METNIRPSAVAGAFYPDHPETLRRMIGDYLQQASPAEPSPCAMVAPHAGYIYSGYTAACAYRTLVPAPESNPRRVILVGPSHRVFLEGVSVGNYGAFQTPLGTVPLDGAAVATLVAEPDVSNDPVPHQWEHALEVHLPFLQETLGHFRLVPMVFGRIDGARLAALILKIWQPDDLIVVSSDLSHFHPYATARKLDGQCHQAMLKQDLHAIQDCDACGNTGMTALLHLAHRHHWRTSLADYRNSGDTAGDKHRVVGYASYLFHVAAPVH
jgi:hypothetical protein